MVKVEVRKDLVKEDLSIPMSSGKYLDEGSFWAIQPECRNDHEYNTHLFDSTLKFIGTVNSIDLNFI